MIAQLLLSVVGAYVISKITSWLIEWARRVLQGFVQGFVALVKEAASVTAFALGRDYDDLEVVDEIEVDEEDLDEDVLEALERNGRLVQKVRI
jgi:hypothetical protein